MNPSERTVFLIHNGPKERGRRAFPAGYTQKTIPGLFPQFRFTTKEREATHVIVPDGVNELGDKLAKRAPRLTHRILHWSDLVPYMTTPVFSSPFAEMKHADRYPVRPVGHASFLKDEENVHSRLEKVDAKDLMSSSEIDLRRKIMQKSKELRDLTRTRLTASTTFEESYAILKQVVQDVLKADDRTPEVLAGWWREKLVMFVPSRIGTWLMKGYAQSDPYAIPQVTQRILLLYELWILAEACLEKLGVFPLVDVPTGKKELQAALEAIRDVSTPMNVDKMNDSSKQEWYGPLRSLQRVLMDSFQKDVEYHKNLSDRWKQMCESAALDTLDKPLMDVVQCLISSIMQPVHQSAGGLELSLETSVADQVLKLIRVNAMMQGELTKPDNVNPMDNVRAIQLIVRSYEGTWKAKTWKDTRDEWKELGSEQEANKKCFESTGVEMPNCMKKWKDEGKTPLLFALLVSQTMMTLLKVDEKTQSKRLYDAEKKGWFSSVWTWITGREFGV